MHRTINVRCANCGKTVERSLDERALRSLEAGARLRCSSCGGLGSQINVRTGEPPPVIVNCLGCGLPIPSDRLAAQPGTRFHVECAPNPAWRPSDGQGDMGQSCGFQEGPGKLDTSPSVVGASAHSSWGRHPKTFTLAVIR
jgi:DNA-directed RNA polymerase subunit RPC12/RpoP